MNQQQSIAEEDFLNQRRIYPHLPQKCQICPFLGTDSCDFCFEGFLEEQDEQYTPSGD